MQIFCSVLQIPPLGIVIMKYHLTSRFSTTFFFNFSKIAILAVGGQKICSHEGEGVGGGISIPMNFGFTKEYPYNRVKRPWALIF